ncbi:hypothetical protein GCM10027160_03270 [Streptomyces calidiresistens]|uniref:AAA family ATPase n=1 Tax=Streptomyces calidiresistens TaxID=1485586 RepID=UPI002B21F728|nr:hypothetical protein [Streptomyces calidiresistens]
MADGVPALGQSAIIDAVNAVEAARRQWRTLAARHRVPVAFIEVVCSDSRVHRQRLERRSRGIPGFEEPTWQAVRERGTEYEPWTDHRLVLDSIADPASNPAKALEYLAMAAQPSEPASRGDRHRTPRHKAEHVHPPRGERCPMRCSAGEGVELLREHRDRFIDEL